MKFRVLLLMFLSIAATAQIKEDKSSIYFDVFAGIPVGKYHTMLKETNANRSNFGFALGYFVSPYKGKKPSKVFYGAEMSYQANGSDAIVSYISGTYRAVFSTFALNGVVRYRPIWWASKINPFFDAYCGPKIYGQKIIEYISEQETSKVWSLPRTMLNYGIGAGTGFQLHTPSGKGIYLDVGIYYQQADPRKIIKRNSIGIDGDGNVNYQQIMSSTNQWKIKAGITGFH